MTPARLFLDGSVFLKVIGFPVPEGSGAAGESMWVKVIKGTDNEGIGELNNIPLLCTEVSLGDIIEYGGGTDDTKPHFVRRAHTPPWPGDQ